MWGELEATREESVKLYIEITRFANRTVKHVYFRGIIY